MNRISASGLALVMLSATLLVSGCGSSGGAPMLGRTPMSGAKTVTIKGFRYHPADLTVSPGTNVTWVNQDRAPHTVTGKGLNLDDLTSGRRSAFTFRRKGTYTYVCSFHPFMRGRVVVR